MGRLDNSVAVITGASSGIGESVARAFSNEGATVVICARGIEKATLVADSIVEAGGKAMALPCDVSKDESVTALQEAVVSQVGVPDIVVNNAGIYKISRFLDTPLDTYRAAMETNYLGVVRMIMAFLPGMIDAGYGKVVNIASTAGKYGSMYQAHYNGSKHAVIGITRSLAIEHAKTGVCINAICPGFVETPMLNQGLEEYADAADLPRQDAREILTARVPMGRFLEPDEISPLAIYLASRECMSMTGQAMTISGGMVLV